MILSWLTMLLLSSSAHADLDEPIDTFSFSRIEPTHFPEGLCPGVPLRSGSILPEPPPEESLDLQALMDLGSKIHSVSGSVQFAYNLPDFETVNSGAELVTRTSSFVKSLPTNYRFYGYFSEPHFGIKYMLLQPKSTGAQQPLILSVVGTQTLLPWLYRLQNREASSLSFSRLVRMFSGCQYLDELGRPLSDRGLIITGHSLGGGVAQAVAYLIQAARIHSGQTPAAIELITFNAFGGKSLVDITETFEPKIAALIPARNYFVGGDIVHNIGEHVGPLYNLGNSSLNRVGLDSAMHAHLMSTVIQQGNQNVLKVSSFVTAPQSKVENPLPLSDLSKVVTITYAVPDQVIPHSKARVVELLNEAALTLELTDLKLQENREVARFIGRLIFSRELSLRDGATFDGEMVRDLKSIRNRIYRSVP